MSTRWSVGLDEDTQQRQQVAQDEEAQVQAVLVTIAARMCAEETSELRTYIRQTLHDGTYPSWMPTSTPVNIGHERAQRIATACDDLDGMCLSSQESEP